MVFAKANQYWGFNPRAREGRDLLILCAAVTAHARFNPRAREGRDGNRATIADTPGRFQSTRPRGARPEIVKELPDAPIVSIHAPARGAT